MKTVETVLIGSCGHSSITRLKSGVNLNDHEIKTFGMVVRPSEWLTLLLDNSKNNTTIQCGDGKVEYFKAKTVKTVLRGVQVFSSSTRLKSGVRLIKNEHYIIKNNTTLQCGDKKTHNTSNNNRFNGLQ
ncbi:MAG: hypothetical protein PHR06_04915 [Candidatus Cloacimonetes bacterium]|nr:hypothetical protein [Candidatus Cloacimonadota bacterium]